MTHTGDFHYPNAARFRATGAFPYPCLVCWADRDAVRRHVEELLENYDDEGSSAPDSSL